MDNAGTPLAVALVAALAAASCDRREEVPTASSPAACVPVDLGAAEDLAERRDLPVDRVVTLEAMPHQGFFGWTQNGRRRAVSKLLGTERRILLIQDFEGEAPPTGTELCGLLRRWSDLPARPWDAVKQGIAERLGWQVPDDAYVLMTGVGPRGCDCGCE